MSGQATMLPVMGRYFVTAGEPQGAASYWAISSGNSCELLGDLCFGRVPVIQLVARYETA